MASGRSRSPNYRDLREAENGLEGLAAWGTFSGSLGGGEPVPLTGMIVLRNYFEVLGARPWLGRKP